MRKNPCIFGKSRRNTSALGSYNGGMKKKTAAQRAGGALLVFTLFYILGRARAAADMIPLGIGLYCALIYCGKNYFISTLAFMGGHCLAGMDLLSLTDAASAAAVFGAAALISYKFALRMRIPAMALCAFLSMLPRFFIGLFLHGIVVQGVTSVVINTAFAAAACIGCFALLVRGGGRFSYDETLSLGLLIAALGLGIYDMDLWGFKPYFTVLTALCMLCAYFPATAGGGICGALAVGAAVYTRDAAAVGAALLVWAAGKCFIGQGKWISAIACEGIYLLCGFVLRAFTPFDALNICLAAAGVFIAALIPGRTVKRWGKALFPDSADALRYAVDRQRRELFDKLSKYASLMIGIADEFERDGGQIDLTMAACADVSAHICVNCTEKDKCAYLAGDVIFKKAVERAAAGEEVSADDFPLFVVSKCKMLGRVLEECSAAGRRSVERAKKREQAQENGAAVAAQMRGMGSVLGKLATRVGKSGIAPEDTGERIVDELGYENVTCLGAAVLGEGEERRITLKLRAGDEEKRAVGRAVSRALGGGVKRVEKNPATGTVTVTYAPAANYVSAFGASGAVKPGSGVAGDTYTVTAIDEGRVLACVCDGMGSGSEAAKESAACLTMLENFCKCGFEKGAVPALINRFLALRGGEKFCALDACIIDLNEGAAEFIKLGGVESFILREGMVKTISGGALPAGILDDITPVFERAKLKDGDMIVLVTDGVTDALTVHGAEYALTRTEGVNPQKTADILINLAKDHDLKDDATVVAIKIFSSEKE